MKITVPQIERLRSRDPLLYEALRQFILDVNAQLEALVARVADLETSDVAGSGTAGYVPKFSAAQELANSVISEAGGWVGINEPAPSGTLEVANPTGSSNLFVVGHGTGASGIVKIRSARGTRAARSASQTGDLIGFIGVNGYGATSFQSGANAAIKVTAAENFTDAAQGTAISLATTPVGTVTRLDRVNIMPNGYVGVNKAAPGTFLAVVGLPSHANNAAAVTAGLTAGDCYTVTGTDPLQVAVVY